jgi:pimeloyl-ACP methyl ester carboxylesterase
VRLAYRVVDAEGAGPSAVLVHGQGAVPVDALCALARRGGIGGTLVVPFGDYATTSSGMEVGGPCWYRSLPGGVGTDPLTLTRAVVQLADLLAEVDLDRPVLLGWRQGAVVAVGAGLFAPGATAGVIAVDVPPTHLALLPAGLSVSVGAPPVLLAMTGRVENVGPMVAADELAKRGVTAQVRRLPDAAANGGNGENEEALAEVVGDFVATTTVPPWVQGGTKTP